MKRVIEFFRVIVISPELLIVLLVVIFAEYSPMPIVKIGARIKSDQELWKYLPVIPTAILVWAFTQAKDILFPHGSSSNKELLDWPLYWKLKLRVLISMGWMLFSVISALAVWFFKNDVSELGIGIVFCISVSVSLVVAVSMWLAMLMIRQIIDK